MKYKEIEFKYAADAIPFAQFSEFCKGRNPIAVVEASGFDHFYESKESPDRFCRHRVGADSNQLTFKRKTTEKNSFVRTERNIDLIREMTLEDIGGLCGEMGYSYNRSIYKNCFVYIYDYYTLVYYICYDDKEMRELGRFIEIEMSEKHGWSHEQEAWEALLVMERVCKPIGITPQARIKRSLFEMFRHEK